MKFQMTHRGLMPLSREQRIPPGEEYQQELTPTNIMRFEGRQPDEGEEV